MMDAGRPQLNRTGRQADFVKIAAQTAHAETGVESRVRPKRLTKIELRTLLQAWKGERYEDLILFFVLTGARLSEALALRWSDVDLGARTAVIRRPVRLRRKNMPTIRFASRTIDLARPLVAALTRRLGAVSRDADLVFQGDAGGRLNARHLRDACRRVAKRAGLPTVSPQVLRHTWAAILLEAGIPIDYVSRSLGHSSTAVTAAAYASARPAPLGDEGSRPAPTEAMDSLRTTRTPTTAQSPERAMMGDVRP